jgi:thiamine phosphate synthase YjbQ (UPF0047 family)
MLTLSQFSTITDDLNELLEQDDVIIGILTSLDVYAAQFTSISTKSTPESLRQDMKKTIQTITNDKPQNSRDARGVNPFIDALIEDMG